MMEVTKVSYVPIITSTDKIRYTVYEGSREGTIQVTKDTWTLTLYNRAGAIKTSTNRASLDYII
jgi:hypothetical protein